MTLYEKFRRLKIDFSAIGLEKGSGRSDYFCTPKGARIIGWEGVDGIHYCFLKDFGEMVFSVNPMGMQGDYVHPLARNFEDFLRLLLACGSVSALERAHAWTKEQFDNFLQENRPETERGTALDAIASAFCLLPMEEPFAYLKKLQEGFDYGKIPYRADYFEWVPEEPGMRKKREWKVFFNGFFYGHRGKDRAGKEVPVGKRFAWGENAWCVPAVYLCGAGLVVDLCGAVEPERIRAFQEKWKLKSEMDFWTGQPDDGTREQLEAENPLQTDFEAKLWINGKRSPSMHGCSLCWTPRTCLLEGQRNEPEAARVLEHYGLDERCGWVIWRISFSWTSKRKPDIESLQLSLEQRPRCFVGIHFTAPKIGESISFSNPLTGAEHVLTVRAHEQQRLEGETFVSEEYEYPRCYSMLTYTVAPQLSDREFSVLDCAESDPPKRKEAAPFMPEKKAAAAIAVIGGADGPTAFFIRGKAEAPQTHVACSSLHFAPADRVEWRMVFWKKMLEDVKVRLL